MNKNDAAWLCGFVNGEGLFTIHIQRYGKNKDKITLRPDFAISLHKKDNR